MMLSAWMFTGRPLAHWITQRVPSPATDNILHSEPYRRPTMGKLDGKVAIVTGAARGLGRAYAKRLAGLGAKVAATHTKRPPVMGLWAPAKETNPSSTPSAIKG